MDPDGKSYPIWSDLNDVCISGLVDGYFLIVAL